MKMEIEKFVLRWSSFWNSDGVEYADDEEFKAEDAEKYEEGIMRSK